MTTPEATTIDHVTLIDASGNITVRLTWPPPNDGGYPITRYRIQYSLINNISYTTYDLVLANSPGAINPISGDISHTLTNLIKGGIYQVRISAINTFGSGAYSRFVYVYPGSVPAQLNAAISEVYASRGSTQVTVNWILPYDGGYPVIGFVLQYRAVSVVVEPTNTVITAITQWDDVPPVNLTSGVYSYTFTGLVNGTYYQFRVAARNDVGVANYCDPLLIKPGDIPGTFNGNIGTNYVANSAARNNGRIFLEWSPPAYNGGYDLQNYVLQYKSATDIYYTHSILPLNKRQINTPGKVSLEYANNVVIESYGDLSANPPIPIRTPLLNDVEYSIRIGVQNDVGIRWLPERDTSTNTNVYAVVVPGTFAKPVQNLSATVADGTTTLSWSWNDQVLNNGYPFAGYYVVRFRQINDLYWHELVYPQGAEKLDASLTVGSGSGGVTLAETGRDVANVTLYTNVVRDTSTNVWNFMDPNSPPYQAKQPLINGSQYVFQVAAVNSIIRGPDTGVAVGQYAQAIQIPGRVPGAPAFAKIQRASNQATLTWSAPSDDGGYPIIAYRIRSRSISVLPSSAVSSSVMSIVASYNRLGTGELTSNSVGGNENSALVSIYAAPADTTWIYTDIIAADVRTFVLPIARFNPNVLFDVSISAQNDLGFGLPLYMADQYSSRPYKPSAPIKLSAQLLKNSTLSGGSGAIYMNWTTPEYYGGALTVKYGYDIEYALVNDTVSLSNNANWAALNADTALFGEIQAPDTTKKVGGIIISATYSIYSGYAGGFIVGPLGTSYIRCIRVRSIAKSTASGSSGTSDEPSEWTVCGVDSID